MPTYDVYVCEETGEVKEYKKGDPRIAIFKELDYRQTDTEFTESIKFKTHVFECRRVFISTAIPYDKVMEFAHICWKERQNAKSKKENV